MNKALQKLAQQIVTAAYDAQRRGSAEYPLDIDILDADFWSDLEQLALAALSDAGLNAGQLHRQWTIELRTGRRKPSDWVGQTFKTERAQTLTVYFGASATIDVPADTVFVVENYDKARREFILNFNSYYVQVTLDKLFDLLGLSQ